MRDTQKSKVYSAENIVFPSADDKIMTFGSCLRFVNKVTSEGYYHEQGGYQNIKVEFSGGKKSSAMWYLNRGKIVLPEWARCKSVIIHEMAHALCDYVTITGRPRHAPRVANHGKEYCTIYLNMVHCYISKKKAVELEESFTKAGVKYTRSNLNF